MQSDIDSVNKEMREREREPPPSVASALLNPFISPLLLSSIAFVRIMNGIMFLRAPAAAAPSVSFPLFPDLSLYRSPFPSPPPFIMRKVE
jgi:hypothetical protein